MQVFYAVVALLGVTIILGGVHWLTIWLVSRFFDLRGLRRRHKMLVIFLPIVFTLAMTVWTHITGHWLARILYTLVWTWLGLVSNAFWLFFLGWLIFLVIGRRFRLSRTVYGFMLVGITTIYTVFGITQAIFPRVTSLNLRVANLPYAWQGKKIVQISDAHLGAVYGPKYLERLLRLAQKQDPDLLVITGDLVDGTRHDYPRLLAPLQGATAKKGIYYISGNHEIYTGMKVVASAVPPNVTILDDRIVNIDGLSLIGVSYPEDRTKDHLAKVLPGLASYATPCKVLLYHSPIEVVIARREGINLMLSGHTHRGQIWPYGLLTRLIYGGLDTGLHTFDDFSLYTTSGSGTWGPPMRTSASSEIVVITLVPKE